MKKNQNVLHAGAIQSHIAKALTALFEDIKSRNDRFSKRAFAKKLGIGPGPLSEFLNDKRLLTAASLEKLARSTLLSDDTRNIIREYLALSGPKEKLTYRQLSQSSHRPIVMSWESFAILALLNTRQKITLKDITKRLPVEDDAAQAALSALLNAGLVRKNGTAFESKQQHGEVAAFFDQNAIRDCHRGGLKLAHDSINRVHPSKREHQTAYIAIRRLQMPLVKVLIGKFMDQMAELEDGEGAEEVLLVSLNACIVSN